MNYRSSLPLHRMRLGRAHGLAIDRRPHRAWSMDVRPTAHGRRAHALRPDLRVTTSLQDYMYPSTTNANAPPV